PHLTVALREVNAVVIGQLLQEERREPSGAGEERARLANNLAIRLRELGRREEALAAAEEAVKAYRALAQVGPGAFVPGLAMSLNNLGIRLGALGRREEALAAAEEGVNVYRALAQARREAFEPDLAASLNNLGNRLSELGRREEAL